MGEGGNEGKIREMPVSGKMDLREAEMFFGFSPLIVKDIKNKRENK